MRKILLIGVFLSLILPGNTAWAQLNVSLTPTLIEDLNADKYYVIKVTKFYQSNNPTYLGDNSNGSDAGYLRYPGVNSDGHPRVVKEATPNNESYLWKLTYDAESGIKIQNARTNLYIETFSIEENRAESGFGLNDNSDNSYTATLANGSTTAYTLRGNVNNGVNNGAWLNYNTADNGIWVAYAEGRAAEFEFYEVSDNLVTVTMNYVHNDFTYHVIHNFVPSGTQIATLLDHFDYYTTGTPDITEVGNENTTVTIPLTSDEQTPIQVGHFYRLGVRGTQTVIRLGNNDIQTKDPNDKPNDGSTNYTNVSNATFHANNMWYFKRVANTPFFTLHCVGAASNKGVTIADNGKAVFTETPTAFILKKSTYNKAEGADYNNSGFALQQATNTTSYLGDHSNDYKNNANERLGIWNNSGSHNDGGSFFVATEIISATCDNTNDDINYSFKCVKNTQALAGENYIAGTEAINNVEDLGAACETTRNTLKSDATDEAKSTAIRTWCDKLSKCGDILGIGDYVEAGKYYRIIGRNDVFWQNNSAYAAADGTVEATAEDSRKVFTATEGTAGISFASTLWQFKNFSGNRTNVTSANTGFYLGDIPQDAEYLVTTKDEKWGRMYTVEGQGGYWTFHDNKDSDFSKNINSIYNSGQNSSNGFCRWGDGLHDAGNCFRIQEVTEIPVTIGQKGFASVCLPMAVSIPEGLTAYKVMVNGTETSSVLLEPITGTIPAESGFLVKGEAGTYNLPIVHSPAEGDLAYMTGNILKGATAERRGIVGDYYCLNINPNTTDPAKFSRVNIENNIVPANKAYFLASDLTGSTGGATTPTTLSLDFGGSETGIQSTITDGARSTEYFDLQGRRVLNPTRGIYVTGNGKKVLFK